MIINAKNSINIFILILVLAPFYLNFKSFSSMACNLHLSKEITEINLEVLNV